MPRWLMSHSGTMHILMTHLGRVHVLMSHSGMVLVDTGKSQFLQLTLHGDWVFSLQIFCCGSFYRQSPASKGGGASFLGTLSLTPSHTINLDTSFSSQPEPTERACPPLSCPSFLTLPSVQMHLWLFAEVLACGLWAPGGQGQGTPVLFAAAQGRLAEGFLASQGALVLRRPLWFHGGTGRSRGN